MECYSKCFPISENLRSYSKSLKDLWVARHQCLIGGNVKSFTRNWGYKWYYRNMWYENWIMHKKDEVKRKPRLSIKV